MAYPEPKFHEDFNLEQLNYRGKCTSERLNAAADGILQYMQSELYMPGSSGMDGSEVKYSGLAKNGSLVVLKGLKPSNEWQTALFTVVNMKEKDDGLVKLIKKVAIEAVKK